MRLKQFLMVLVCSFAVSLVVWMPVTVMQQGMHALGVDTLPWLGPASGTLVAGQAQFKWVQPPAIEMLGQLNWRLRPASLLRAKLAYDIEWSWPGAQLTATVDWGLLSRGITALAGELTEQAISPWLAANGVTLTGRLQLHQVSMRFQNGFALLSDAQGTLHWSGGPMHLVQRHSAQPLMLPSMKGILTDAQPQTTPESFQLSLSDADTAQQYLIITLQQDRVKLTVNRSLMDALNWSVPGNQPVIFEIEDSWSGLLSQLSAR